MAADKTLTIRILTDTRDTEAGMDKVSKKTEGMGAAFRNAAALAATYLAGKALAAVNQFVSESVEAFSDLNESLNALNVQFGDDAAGIKDLGEAAAQSIGASNAQFNQYAVSVSAFARQIAGDGGDIVATVDQMSKRTADFASVMNLDFGEASEKFRSGLAGESEPLRQYGIDVSAARVETQALKDGIWDGVGAMTEAQKVQARWNTIMEQTDRVAGDFANTSEDLANKLRIQNAEIENNKARVGEALVPWKEFTSGLELLGAKTLGILATGFMDLTGQISDARAAINEFQIHTGATADTLKAAVTINKDYGVSFSELFAEMKFAEGELRRLTDENKAFLESIGYSQEEIAELSGLIDDKLVSAQNAARDAARHHRGAQDEVTEAVEATEEAVDSYADRLRAMSDPVFAAIRASEDAAAAQEAYNDAVAEFGPDSAEAIAAAGDLLGANLDLKGAQDDLIAAGPDFREQFRLMATQMGLPKDQIDAILERLETLDAFKISDKTFNVRASGVGSSSGRIAAQHGGIAQPRPGGVPVQAAEAGVSEGFIPLNDEGARFMAAMLRAAGFSGGGGGDGPIVVQVVVDGKVLLEAVRRADRRLS